MSIQVERVDEMATKKSNKEEVVVTQTATVSFFTKKQLVGSYRYIRYVDFLNGNLQNDKLYTLEQVDKMILDFYGKGKGE